MPKKLSESLTTLPLRLDSNVYLFEELDELIALYEAYRIDDTTPITVKRIGTWTKLGGLGITFMNIWERRRNLQGFNVSISASHVKLLFACSMLLFPRFFSSTPTIGPACQNPQMDQSKLLANNQTPGGPWPKY